MIHVYIPLLILWITMLGCNSNRFFELPEEERFTILRKKMVEEQLKAPGRDIKDPRVLAAMEKVPRHKFVPKEFINEAYNDYPLPIGFGQTISQPFIVAFMTEQLKLTPTDKVLEIGTGSGYQAAILAELAKEVYTIEIIPELAERARQILRELSYTNVFVKTGDGYKGWPEAAPFDAIMLTCAPDHIPPLLIEQLKPDGRMILPITGPLGMQELVLLVKEKDKLIQKAILPVRFVPMTGEAQKQSRWYEVEE